MDPTTGESKGFGFVEMPKPGEAKIAMQNINARQIDGHKVRVKKAEDKVEDEAKHQTGSVTAQTPEDKDDGLS